MACTRWHLRTEAVEGFVYKKDDDGSEHEYGVAAGFAGKHVVAMTFFEGAYESMKGACQDVPVALRLRGGMVGIRQCLN